MDVDPSVRERDRHARGHYSHYSYHHRAITDYKVASARVDCHQDHQEDYFCDYV